MSKTLVIMAAGMGSRFGGDKQISALGPSGEMLMEYSVYDALKAGFTKIIFVIRPGMQTGLHDVAERMKAAHPYASFLFSEQINHGFFGDIPISPSRSKPLGTVHAVLSAAPYIDSPFAVINADDYYGRDAIISIADALDSFSCPADSAMVAYPLKNTLSKHGAVTRGICTIENGKLKSIREAYKVCGSTDGTVMEQIDSLTLPLSSKSVVSMNMWAFHNDFIPHMSAYFRNFLSNLPMDDNKSECLLPIMVQQFIKNGELQVAAYPTQCRWFGLTHRQDAEDAAWELDKRHQDGSYPNKLF